MKKSFLFALGIMNVLTTFSQQWIPYKDPNSGKFAYVNELVAQKPTTFPYEYASYFNIFETALVKENGLWSMLDKNLKPIAGGWADVQLYKFESLEANENYAIVKSENTWKYFRSKSKTYSDGFDSLYRGHRYMFEDYSLLTPLWSAGKINFYNFQKNTTSQAYDGILYDNSNNTYFTPDQCLFMRLNGKVVITDANGNPQSTYDFVDTTQAIDYDFFAIKNNGMWNVITIKGKYALKDWIPEEDFFYHPENDYVFIKKNGKRYAVDCYKFKMIEMTVSKDNEETYDLISEYLFIGNRYDDYAVMKKEKYGFVNAQLDAKIPFIYDNAHDFNGELAFVKKGDLWGGIDKKGNNVIPFQYSECKSYYQEYIVCKDGKWGLIDVDGKIIIPFDYENMESTGYSYYIVKKGIKYGMINKLNNVIIPNEFNDVKMLEPNIAGIKKGENWAFWSLPQKKAVTGFNYVEIVKAFGKFAIVKKDSKQWLVDIEKDKIISSNGYGRIEKFIDGMAMVYNWNIKDGSRYGFINEAGEEVIPLKFTYAQDFNKGLAKVKISSKEFLIDKTGKEVITEKAGKK